MYINYACNHNQTRPHNAFNICLVFNIIYSYMASFACTYIHTYITVLNLVVLFCKCNALMCNVYVYFNPLTTENYMGPKKAYKEFEAQLLESLKFAADQPDFIELLKEKDIISEKTKKNLDMPNQPEGVRAALILEEIRESFSVSNEKFGNLLLVMNDYDHGLETLAQKIQKNLDPSMYLCIHKLRYTYIRTY